MADDKKKPVFNLKDLSPENQDNFSFVKKRIGELQEARRMEQFGIEIEKLWIAADQDYAPHRLGFNRLGLRGKKSLVEDEDKGWRAPAPTSSLVNLGGTNWQSDISQSNPFVKIQIALSILVDQNPTGVFTAANKKFQYTTELIKQLYSRSWEVAESKQQLKLFIFNLAKYGWAAARTYPLKITNTVKNLTEYNEENPDKSKYEDKEVIEYNDVFRENLDPWNVWIDDMAKPNNKFSVRDWTWRKIYSYDQLEQEFGNWKNFKLIKEGPHGTVTDKIDQTDRMGKKYTDSNLYEVYFYENKMKDLFEVHVGGVDGIPLIQSPLPISDGRGNKKLSLWQTYWNLRHAECPVGIGIYEAIRYDQALLDRIRNMTIDQLTLSIYKMFFYQGTSALTETGDIKLSPGVGKQTLDPKNIQFMQVPGPGADAWQGLQIFKNDLDESSGITDPLMGNVTGKTAFEIAQAKESALKRLKTPLDNITDALNTEAYISVSLMQLLYSIPEVYTVTDPDLIEDYLKEIQSDPQLYDRTEAGQFQAKVYPEFPLNLSKNEKGHLIETKETEFFRIKPDSLKWEGIINVKSQSVLSPSKQVDKALEQEMFNILIPLLAQPPQLYTKIAKEICKLYDKDPDDVLPDAWLQEELPQSQNLIIPTSQSGMSPNAQNGPLQQEMNPVPPQAQSAPSLVPQGNAPTSPQAISGTMTNAVTGQ